MPTMILINPAAGRKMDINSVRNFIGDRFKGEGEDFHIIQPGTVEEWQGHIRAAPAQGFDKLLVVGGDGSIHQSLKTFDFDKLSLGILPTGSGNDIYRSFRIPIKPLAALDNFFAGEELVDVGEAAGRLFLNTAGIGLDSWTVLVKEQTTGWLSNNYVYLFIKTFRMLRAFDVEIEMDDTTIHKRALWVVAANNGFIGGGMRIAPDADMRDGFLDVLIVGQILKAELIFRIPSIFRGTHVNHPKIEVIRGRKVTIKCADEIPCAIDGELYGNPPLEIKLHPRKLRLRGRLPDRHI